MQELNESSEIDENQKLTSTFGELSKANEYTFSINYSMQFTMENMEELEEKEENLVDVKSDEEESNEF